MALPQIKLAMTLMGWLVGLGLLVPVADEQQLEKTENLERQYIISFSRLSQNTHMHCHYDSSRTSRTHRHFTHTRVVHRLL